MGTLGDERRRRVGVVVDPLRSRTARRSTTRRRGDDRTRDEARAVPHPRSAAPRPTRSSPGQRRSKAAPRSPPDCRAPAGASGASFRRNRGRSRRRLSRRRPPGRVVAEPPSAPAGLGEQRCSATAVLDAPTVQTPVVIPPAPAPTIPRGRCGAGFSAAGRAGTRCRRPAGCAAADGCPPATAGGQRRVLGGGRGSASARFKLPFSAVLEATAVLLILVFILLRLS